MAIKKQVQMCAETADEASQSCPTTHFELEIIQSEVGFEIILPEVTSVVM